MGCAARVVLYATDEPSARAHAKAAFSRMKALEHALSDYDPQSESELLGAASGDGVMRPVSADLFEMLRAARWMAQRSDGAFDPTCGALTRLWRAARRAGVPPDAVAAANAARTISWRAIALHATEQRAALQHAGARLDFGGIAKGHAVCEASRLLAKRGAPMHMVSIEGDIALGAAPPDAHGWKVEVDAMPAQALERPQASTPARPPSVDARCALLLAHCVISTSGDNFQHLVVGNEIHSHILDPRTGKPLTRRVAASVIAQEGLVADGAATALCALETSQRAGFVQRMRIAARIVEATASGLNETTYGPWPCAESVVPTRSR